jgi:hypothetical protein
MRPPDPKAEMITFGVELETAIPATSAVSVGGYHHGAPVLQGRCRSSGAMISAPTFLCAPWKAKHDGSIRVRSGQARCEFVSPVLYGPEGVRRLLEFVDFANAIGSTVNASCGCHITVGVGTIIGTTDPQAVGRYARKLAHIARWHAMSLYGQTGTGRHLNRFSHTLADDVACFARRMETLGSVQDKANAANCCGRGMVNFRKLFSHGVIEFRVFAGTLNRQKLLHHLATVLGLCRRAAEVECLGGFQKNKDQAKRTASASEALRYLWNYLGWTGGRRPVALGLFGDLHDGFGSYRGVAERMCRRFDARFPYAQL